MKRRDLWGTLLCLAVLTASCSKNTIYMECGCGEADQGDLNPPQGSTLVSFQASIEGRNFATRALSPVQRNVQAEIYAFDPVASLTGLPEARGSYIALSPGSLTGMAGYKMKLPAGVYNFYAVSDNTQFTAPSFSAGFSEGLHNGIDYLWCGALRQEVTTAQAAVPIVFLHCATQVSFQVTAGEGITLNRLALAHLYLPQESARMELGTGVIPPATTYQSQLSKMTVSGSLALATMLPVQSDTPLSVWFDVLINGESTARTFAVTVPLPDGALKSGNSYLFKAVIRNNTVEFPSVGVTPWVDVDQTGHPLYPAQE